MAIADPITPPPARCAGRVPRAWTAAELAAVAQLPAFAGRSLALAGGTLVETHPDGPRPLLFTRDETYALERANFFRNQRVRLIRGVLVQEPRMSPPHATAILTTTRALGDAFPAECHGRVQLPIYLEGFS